MNIELTDLEEILLYLETTNLEPHNDYTSEFTYKDQKILYKYIKELQQENKHLDEVNCKLRKTNERLKDNWIELRKWIVYNKHNENTEQHYLVVDYGTLLGKMRELQGSDNK